MASSKLIASCFALLVSMATALPAVEPPVQPVAVHLVDEPNVSDHKSDHGRVPDKGAVAACRTCGKWHERPSKGSPRSIAWYAKCVVNPRYQGAYVGGGGWLLGRGREPGQDGTWGVDYVGGLLKRHVFLGWHHGFRRQGGTGAYETDGLNIKHEIRKRLEREE